MFTRLFLIFVLVPLADLVLLLMLAGIHWQLTVLLILVSGLLGAFYVRRQGMEVMGQLRETLTQNQMPTDILIEGGLVVFAAALLITPGIITDLFGLSLLIRPCRRWYRKRLIAWMKKRVKIETVSFGEGSPFDQNPFAQGNVVDGEVVDGEVVDGEVVESTIEESSGSGKSFGSQQGES